MAPAPPRRARERRGGGRHARRVLGARAGASEQAHVRVDRHHEERREPGVKRARGVCTQLLHHRYLSALVVERPARHALGQSGVVKDGVLVDVKRWRGCGDGMMRRWNHVERRPVLMLMPSLLGSGAAAQAAVHCWQRIVGLLSGSTDAAASGPERGAGYDAARPRQQAAASTARLRDAVLSK